MISKPINLVNAKSEEMYGNSAIFWFYTPSKRSYLMQTNFCYRISQLTQLTSPERFDQMNCVWQREESLRQFVSTHRAESLPQVVSGICYHSAILQNLSEQDSC